MSSSFQIHEIFSPRFIASVRLTAWASAGRLVRRWLHALVRPLQVASRAGGSVGHGLRFWDGLRVLEYAAPNHVDSSLSAGTLLAVPQSASSIPEFADEAMPSRHVSEATRSSVQEKHIVHGTLNNEQVPPQHHRLNRARGARQTFKLLQTIRAARRLHRPVGLAFQRDNTHRLGSGECGRLQRPLPHYYVPERQHTERTGEQKRSNPYHLLGDIQR